MGCKRNCRCGKCKECGCEEMLKAECTFFYKDYPALGITKGDNLETAFDKLESKIEELNNIQDGVGIESSNVDENNLLTFTLIDGSVIEAGTINIP